MIQPCAGAGSPFGPFSSVACSRSTEVEPRRGESRHHRVGRVIGERAAVEADDAAGRQQHDLARRAALGVERDRAGSPICCVCPVHGATMGIAMRLE